MEDKRARFIKIFANIPDNLRDDIIVVVDKKPYTWNSAFFEIKNKTKLSIQILRVLEETQII